MKDRKLVVKVKCTSKIFYLSPPPPGENNWHVRFTPPRQVRERLGISDRVLRTTGFKDIGPAKIRAAEIIESFWYNDGAVAEQMKARSNYASIGEVLEVYAARAMERPRTKQTNANALRLMVRTVLPGQPDDKSTMALTGDLIRRFAEARGDKVSSTASYVRQARSVLARAKMRFYEKLRLPDLTGFRGEPVQSPCRIDLEPLDTNALLAMDAAAPALAESDPGAYVAHLLFSRLALRNIEILNARKHWIVDGRLGVINRPSEGFRPKGKSGWLPIAPDVLAEIQRFEHLTTDGYLVPGATMTERHKAIYRRHSRWVSTWIHDRRKTSYELRRYAGSRLLDMPGVEMKDVRDFLRHESTATSERWYAYRLQNRSLPTIGMKELVPVRAVA